MPKIVRALTIAGFDGSGGAGIQADIKTFSALECYAMSVLTALPVQNTCGVQSVYEIPLKSIEEQYKAIFDDIGVDVVKIGMLFNIEIIDIVAHILGERKPKIIVVDPVMVAKSGHHLLQSNAIHALVKKIFPLATIITPNIPEASRILGNKIVNEQDKSEAAELLINFGPKAAVVKGGHSAGKVAEDVLHYQGQEYRFATKRINTINNHGTGCTFSSAIAAFLGHGYKVQESVAKAKKYVTDSMISYKDQKIGEGHGPVNHFHLLHKNGL